MGQTQRAGRWTPRSSYNYSDSGRERGCSRCFDTDVHATNADYDDYDNDGYSHDYGYERHRRRRPPPCVETVTCRVRRYRLYARPAYGWCRGFNTDQWQYAVTEEGVPNAVFIVLNDDPRAGAGRRRCRAVWQQLHSGDLIRIPGEPGPFVVHLYADDYSY